MPYRVDKRLTEIIERIECPHCGAPISIQPGELVATCKYCGFTSVIETGKAFEYEHSLILNKLETKRTIEILTGWMQNSFMAPKDLAKKAKITETTLVYVPFWIVSLKASTHYKGVFERISPPVTKEGDINKDYAWLVLARKASYFPTSSYKTPLEAKIPFDFTKVQPEAKVLNSEVDVDEAVSVAQEEIENLHSFLSKQDVDKLVEFSTSFEVKTTTYLHAPIWFLSYQYRNSEYRAYVDGSTGDVIKCDLPVAQSNF